MVKLSAISIPKEIILTVALVGVAVIAPMFHSQLVTGMIVNAALFAAVTLVGFRAACAVAIIPSLIALGVGTLPAAMAAMVPYIMASNIALVGIFALLRKTGYWLAAGVAILSKFAILVLSATAILTVITHGNISLALASMMGWPQLITAIMGAIAAWAVCKNIRIGKK